MDTQSLFNVKGKVVLITGGARGIGLHIARGFVTNGAKVYIASRNAEALNASAAALNELTPTTGGSAVAIPADLSKLEHCKNLIDTISEREGRLHVLVNNSATSWGAEYETYPDHAWTKVLTLNLHRVFTITQLATPLLEKAATKGDPARVMNIGSVSGLVAPRFIFAYSSSKAGLISLSNSLAQELGPRNITSNYLACGFFLTKMAKPLLDRLGESAINAIPLGRFGEPEDVAGTCLFLASRAGAFVNGATISLDGGQSVLSNL